RRSRNDWHFPRCMCGCDIDRRAPSCPTVAGDIGHVLTLSGRDQPNHLASRRRPPFCTFPGGGITSATAVCVSPVMDDQDRQALDAGEDREGGNVACTEYGPCGPVPTRCHHAGEGGLDAFSDEQTIGDIGIVGELDCAVLGGAECQACGLAVDLERGP